MMKRTKFDVMDVGGGLIDSGSMPRTLLPSRNWSRLENFKTFGRYLKRRNGISAITSAAYSENLKSLFAFKRTTGDWDLLAGGLTGIAKLSGTLSALPISDGGTISSQPYQWAMKQRNDIVYVARKSTGTLRRCTGDFLQNAGIDAPATALTIAQGAVGVLPAGDYSAVYTYANSATGAESNPSPVSNTLTLGALRTINYTGIVNSTNGQVDTINIYRTIPDQTGEYYFVASISNFVTVYSGEEVETADMGDAASYKNGLPPDLVSWFEIWNERGWCTDGTDLFFSPLGMVESYDTDVDSLSVYREDGHEVRVLHGFGDRMLVGKTNSIRFVSGVDQFSVGTLTDRHGCVAPGSMKSALGLVFWYSGENFYGSDGVTPRAISDKNIRALLERIPEESKEQVVAAIYPKENWYIASFPVDSGTENSVEAVYNYKDNTWTTFLRTGGRSPAGYGDFYDSDYNQLLYGVLYDGHVYDLDSGNTDAGSAIVAVAETPDLGYDDDVNGKGSRFFSLLCTTVSGYTLTLKAYLNGSASAFKTRTGLLLDRASPWKRFNLSTMSQLARTIRYGIEYSGVDPIQIDAYSSEVVVGERTEKAA